MADNLKDFLDRNLAPIGVVACVAAALVFAAQIKPKMSGTAKLAGIAASGLAAPEWKPLPPATSAIRKIGFASCFRQQLRAPIWQAIAAAKPDVFLMMGDNVYGDIRSKDLGELREAYNALAKHPDFVPAIAAMPILAVWDDHDYGKNDGGGDFVHRDGARQLFNTFWKGSGTTNDAAANDGVQYSKILGPEGRRIQIIMLDTRSYRSPLLRKPRLFPGRGRYRADVSSEKTMLGEKQWAWLDAQLQKPAEIRLIVSSIQVQSDGHAWERWGNLPRERAKLYSIIRRSKANGVIFLSGDRHRAALYRNDEAAPYPLYEVTSSSLNAPYDDPKEKGPYQLHRMYGKVNFGMMTVDWTEGKIILEIRGEDGKSVRSQTINLSDLRPKS